MLELPDKLEYFNHPAVDNCFMKQKFNDDHKSIDVLVIETNLNSNNNDDRFISLLYELETIKGTMAANSNFFDEVEIRFCS